MMHAAMNLPIRAYGHLIIDWKKLRKTLGIDN